MELKDIMSVSGQGGLFKYVSQARNGIIVESFEDNKRAFISVATKVSSLEDVSVFTEGKEVRLKDVFINIHKQGPDFSIPEPKASPEELKKFMETVLPEYDRNRVYVSDIKKIANWYTVVHDNNLVDFESLLKEETAEKKEDQETPSGKENEEVLTQSKKPEKPAKTKTPKNYR